ncbi:MAG: tRNA guanosine(34) transglycosylase Tgt [SAR324 cluster bacterium]|nr:tRNA guanosine(34) transglycosylase Tgt [SAR324 cluster bacterium]
MEESTNKFKFSLLHVDPTGARSGEIQTPHGKIETPIFMPVGTAGAMKAMTTRQLLECSAQILLSNAYHLHLQPGTAIIKKLGGLHSFMDWHKPILTDSGGFQVFSLPKKEITQEGVKFKNQKTGDEFFLSPENSISSQNDLGADIIMAFDECVPGDADKSAAKKAAHRTLLWANRCLKAHKNKNQALFGISQGSIYKDLRIENITELKKLDFPGYALGGLSVGEGIETMSRVLNWSVPLLPENKPRYVMGIGLPEDILCAVESGIDMFDCIIPTRYARSGVLFTYGGKIRIRSGRYKHDKYPVDTRAYSYTSQNFTRAYLNHLYKSNEILAATLGSIHNIHFFMDFVKQIRNAIFENRFAEYKIEFLKLYTQRNKHG